MALDNTESQDVDLERTDRLPVLNLNPALVDDDVADDAVRLDMTTVVPRNKSEFQRAPGVDLPSLAQSVRSVEERIARQKADFDALGRAHEKIRAAEGVAIARVGTLTGELSIMRGLLETEQTRSRQLDKSLAEKTATFDAIRSRLEDTLLEVERCQSEARTLRDTLVARDATIVQVLHSLGERDTQLSALQREHARLVPVLEERSRAGVNLETDLRSVSSRAEAAESDLCNAQVSVSTLTERIKANELELAAVRRDLSNARLLTATHQERLRTREWREGFDQNVVRDLDATLAAAQADRGVLKTACDQLRQRVSELESKLATREEAIAKLQAVSVDAQAVRAASDNSAAQVETVRSELMQRISGLESDKADLQRHQDKVVMAEQTQAALRSEVARLQAELQTREEEMAVLHAHLQVARQPPESADVESKRVMDELAAKGNALDRVREENRNLSAALERARGALEEREFLIRRLERSESNNANALGRIQTSIERMGTAPGLPGVPGAAASSADCSAEMVRMDGEQRIIYRLGRRTRIGRAPGCEIQIDSSSVSRHHALVLVGMREVIVEDLNSTNGVLVNGRKASRQLLSDGDQLTIGEAQFKLNMKVEQRPPEPAPETP